MTIKTYTNKSNAARAAKKANNGTLDGLTLLGKEGAWYYGTKPAPAKKSAPAKKAAPAKKSAPLGRTAAVKSMLAEEYDVKNGPTQGRIRGYHIDTDRDERHGVKRRSAGTIGGRLWAIFAKLSTAAGGPEKLEIAAVKENKEIALFNRNKVLIEFYLWRRYMGVRGRGRKQKVDK